MPELHFFNNCFQDEFSTRESTASEKVGRKLYPPFWKP